MNDIIQAKSRDINEINTSIFTQELFGVKHVIKNSGVEIKTFTPSIDIDFDYNASKSNFKVPPEGLKSFQVSLVSPLFLPLRKSLNGLYEKRLHYFSEILENNEKISVIWLFNKRNNWKETAVEMYESYLKGVDDPSEVKLFRKIEDGVHSLFNKLTSPLQQREYSDNIERKILDDGYLFQCTIEIQSERVETLASLIQDVLAQYDWYNRMRLTSMEYLYPYILYTNKLDFKHQILGREELFSLFINSEQLEEGVNNEKQLVGDGNIEGNSGRVLPQENITIDKYWGDKVKMLPHIEKEKVNLDNNTTITRLAEALKRTGVIKQARLYNETVEYGSRLIVIHADTPKDKNFTDVYKKLKDIQVAMGVESLGIEQGDQAGTIKYSIPHKNTQPVSLRELIEREDFQEYAKDHNLPFIAGVDEIDNPLYLSLKDLVHILIAGKTGSGKSVFLNQMLTTLLATHSPDELNLLLIDPKQVELQQYESFPHTREVITNMSKAIKAFNGLVKEMEERYKVFSEAGVKDLVGYTKKTGKNIPRLVCVVEEWADLFSVAGKDAEEVVMRLGQMARAAGIHLIIVTQRPSAKILSGDIKSNVQNTFCFNLGNNTNYRTVFGEGIPYTLLGQGDGVMKIDGSHKEFQRFQSPIITLDEVEESEIYENLSQLYKQYSKPNHDNATESESSNELLNELKHVIATTKETKTTVLREKLGVRNEILTELMNQLVNEGWLIKHRNRSKGYELIADEEKMSEWVIEEGRDKDE